MNPIDRFGLVSRRHPPVPASRIIVPTNVDASRRRPSAQHDPVLRMQRSIILHRHPALPSLMPHIPVTETIENWAAAPGVSK